MTKKKLKEVISKIKELENIDKYDEAFSITKEVVKELFSNKQYSDILLLNNKTESVPICFSLAYSYDCVGKKEEAEETYETILSIPHEENNTAVLNNLSNIKKTKGDILNAFDLIQKAYKIDSSDKIIVENYNSLLSIIQENEKIKTFFESAQENLKKENDWALNKLKYFIENVKNDKEYKDNKIPIAKYKFKILIGTDEQKADSLRTQWLKKGYIRDTKNKTNFYVSIYEINPNIEKYLKVSIPRKINKEWIIGLDNLNTETLEKLNYYDILEKIEKKTDEKYKVRILRDFDELIINYILRNKKATIILAGSFIELLFTFVCEREKLYTLNYSKNNKNYNPGLYDCCTIFFNILRNKRNIGKL